jgi:hypothetical protein
VKASAATPSRQDWGDLPEDLKDSVFDVLFERAMRGDASARANVAGLSSAQMFRMLRACEGRTRRYYLLRERAPFKLALPLVRHCATAAAAVRLWRHAERGRPPVLMRATTGLQGGRVWIDLPHQNSLVTVSVGLADLARWHAAGRRAARCAGWPDRPGSARCGER